MCGTTGEWSDCSKPCGGGEKTIKVSCFDKAGNLADESLCTGKRPESTVQCNTRNCDTCADIECMVNGECRVLNGQATCVCSKGFSGDNCQTATNCPQNSFIDKEGRCCTGELDKDGECCDLSKGYRVDMVGKCGIPFTDDFVTVIDADGNPCVGVLTQSGSCCNIKTNTINECGNCVEKGSPLLLPAWTLKAFVAPEFSMLVVAVVKLHWMPAAYARAQMTAP